MENLLEKEEETTTSNGFYRGQGLSCLLPDSFIYSTCKLKAFLHKITGRGGALVQKILIEACPASVDEVKVSWSKGEQQASFQHTPYRSLRIPANRNPISKPRSLFFTKFQQKVGSPAYPHQRIDKNNRCRKRKVTYRSTWL